MHKSVRSLMNIHEACTLLAGNVLVQLLHICILSKLYLLEIHICIYIVYSANG